MPPTRVRFIVLAGLCMAASLAYLTRNSLGTAESTIRGDLAMSKEQSGWLLSAFFWPYALCQIPAAALAQRLGARRALPLFSVLSSLATAMFAAGSLVTMIGARAFMGVAQAGVGPVATTVLWTLATVVLAVGNLVTMIGARAFMGVAQAGLVPVGTSVMARWFPGHTQASASGAFSGFMSAGSIIAAPLTAGLVVTCGWRWMFVWYALPGILWALWFANWYRNHPSENPNVNQAERQLISPSGDVSANSTAQAIPAIPWGLLASSPAMWCICAQQFCRAAGYIFFGTWFATYLQEARGVTILSSGWLTTLPLLADLTGCVFGGVLSDAVLRWTHSQRMARQGVSAVALLLCAGLIYSAWFVDHPVMAVIVISGGMFCAAFANPCLGATVMSVGGAQVATVGAVANMSGNLGAALFPVVVPFVLRQTGSWNAVVLGFGALYITAATFWWLLKSDRDMFDPAAHK